MYNASRFTLSVTSILYLSKRLVVSIKISTATCLNAGEGESAFNFRCNLLGICFIRGDCSLPSSSDATCSVFQCAFRADITVRNNMTVLHNTVGGVCHVDSCNSAVSLATSFSNVSFSVSSAAVLFRFTCSLFSRVWRSGPHMTSISWHRALVNTAKEVKIVSMQGAYYPNTIIEGVSAKPC